jgi:hypothetical protein
MNRLWPRRLAGKDILGIAFAVFVVAIVPAASTIKPTLLADIDDGFGLLSLARPASSGWSRQV